MEQEVFRHFCIVAKTVMEGLATRSHCLNSSLTDFCNQSHRLLELTIHVAQD
jgi:hypothetical protein